MNHVKTSFLSLLDGAVNGMLRSCNQHGSGNDIKNIYAPFLELKTIADAQAKRITALEARLVFIQARLNRMDKIGLDKDLFPRRSWDKAECKHGHECTCEYGCGVK